VSGSGRPEIALRHLLLPVGLVLAVVLRWRLGWGKGATFGVALSFVALSFLMGPMVGRAKVAFDRALVRALQRGNRDALWPLYRRQWILRLFGERRFLAAKRGLIQMETGDPRGAADSFREALRGASEAERPLLDNYLANALYALGEDGEAERTFRKLLADGADQPQVYHHLAHGILRRGGKAKEAAALLEKGLKTAGDGPTAVPLRITLAEALVALRDTDRARRLLRESAQASDGPLGARHALVEGKVLSASGDEGGARRCYSRARDLDPDGPTGREAQALLERAA
jgi:tetratricopeptide (TPR) repeat protein